MIPFPDKKYKVIYADPPWRYEFSRSEVRSIEAHYPTMDLEDIKKLPIRQIADKNCALLMWITWPKMEEAVSVVNAWGFKYRSVAFVWIKTNPNGGYFWGMGNWTRANSEVCIIATKGRPKRLKADIHQLVFAPIAEHSKKPDIVRRKIVELLGDVPRIELFARQKAYGWDVWGNQVENLPTIEEYSLS